MSNSHCIFESNSLTYTAKWTCMPLIKTPVCVTWSGRSWSIIQITVCFIHNSNVLHHCSILVSIMSEFYTFNRSLTYSTITRCTTLQGREERSSRIWTSMVVLGQKIPYECMHFFHTTRFYGTTASHMFLLPIVPLVKELHSYH